MPELSTKLQILAALARTSNHHFSVAELMAWTGLRKDQIEPQIARLKEQKIIEDAPVQRTASEKPSRGRPPKLYQASGRVYEELARVRRSLGLPDPISPELERGLELLGKLEAVLSFTEARQTPLTAREHDTLAAQIDEIERTLRLAGMEADLDDEESEERRRLIEAWRRKQEYAARIEKLRQPEPAEEPIGQSRGWRAEPVYAQPVYAAAYPPVRMTRAWREWLNVLGQAGKPITRLRGPDVWHPFYDSAHRLADEQSKEIVIGFLNEARDELRTLECIGSNLDVLDLRNYAIAKTAARYLPDPDIPLNFGVASGRANAALAEIPLNEALFLVRAQRPAEEAYLLWQEAARYKPRVVPVRLEVAAIVQLGRLNPHSWQRLESAAGAAGAFSFVSRRQLGFVHRPCEPMIPLLESTVSGPVEFAHPVEPSYYLYGSSIKDLLSHNAGFDYLQLAQAMVSVGAPQSLAWRIARKIDDRHGLVLLISPAAHVAHETTKFAALRRMLEAEFGAEVLSPPARAGDVTAR
jgi:predicted ArsR family transcriptional regulator